MALPSIKYPKFKETIPSTGEVVYFRPFTVREENILLIAEQSNDIEDITRATNDVLCACFGFDENKKLTTYDVEYLYLKLTAKSVSSVAEIAYRVTDCPETGAECDKIINMRINLDDVKIVKYNEDSEQYETYTPEKQVGGGFVVELADNVGVIMTHPTRKEQEAIQKLETSSLDDIVKECIISVYDEETAYTRADFSKEELDEFYSNLIYENKKKLIDFINNIPELRYEKELKCSTCGYTEKIVYRSLEDFFG